jgi:hypothetical protein
MLFLALITATIAIELDGDFIIEFNPNCSQFFVLRGKEDYAYLYREDNNFILWHTRNDSYAIFSHPWSDPMVFEWPSIINGQNMEIVLSQDKIGPPFQFDEEEILCEYYGLATGTMIQCPTMECELFKCEQTFKTSIQYVILLFVTVIAGLALVAAGLGNYEPIKVILQSLLSRIIQRRWEFLPRGQEAAPPSYQETDI